MKIIFCILPAENNLIMFKSSIQVQFIRLEVWNIPLSIKTRW